MSRFLGIDPGINGALGLIDTDDCTLAIVDMPVELTTKSRKLTSPILLAAHVHASGADYVFLEEVGAQPGEGAVGAFSFGRGVGRIEGVAAGALVPCTLVRPNEWKPKLGVPKDKKQAVTRAMQLFPGCAQLFTGPRGGLKDGRAEAGLIAFYGAVKMGCTPARPLRLVHFPEPSYQDLAA